jgi:hypothetical protein
LDRGGTRRQDEPDVARHAVIPCPARGAARRQAAWCAADAGPYRTQEFRTIPRLQRTAAQGRRAALRAGNVVRGQSFAVPAGRTTLGGAGFASFPYPLGRGDGAPRRRTVLAIAPSRAVRLARRRRLRGVSHPLAIGDAIASRRSSAALFSPGLLARVVVHAGDTVAAPGGMTSPGAGNRSTLRPTAYLPEDALGEPR